MAEDYLEFQGFEFYVSDFDGTKQIMCKVKNGTFGGASALSINWIQDESKRKDYEELVELINEKYGTRFQIKGFSIFNNV